MLVVAATVFYEKQSVLQFLCNVLNFRDTPSELRDYERKQFAKDIKGKQERMSEQQQSSAWLMMVQVS